MRFQRQLGGLKLLEIRGHGTLWFHLLSSPLHLLFETRSFNELFLTTSIYVGRSSCDLRRRKKTWLFLPHLFQAVRSERLFNARSPRKSTKRQSKVGSKWVNKSIMKEWKQNLCFLFLNWLRPLNHLGITKWRCVWAYRDLWTWLDPRCRQREDWRWPRKKRKTRSMLFFWKLSMEDGKSRDEMSHKFHSEVLQSGATLVNFGWLFCFGRIKRHLLFGSKLEHEYYNI